MAKKYTVKSTHKPASKTAATAVATWVTLGLVAIICIVVFAMYLANMGGSTDVRARAAQLTGNGAPSGTHYNLNIHGVPKDKSASLTDSSGHNIFIPEFGKCKINLFEGEFDVLDGNCTDGPAAFQLPNPDPTNTGVTTYSVWARALGKPGGSANASTCADLVTTDPATGLETTSTYCSVYTLTLQRTKGKSSFGDVSKYLLYIYADLNGDGVLERYPLFDPALQGYFWDWNNQGLKLTQLRFYPIPSTVPAP